MRRFYLRGLIEEKMGVETDWKAADSAFVQAVAIAREVAKYRHAQLSAVRLAGDNGRWHRRRSDVVESGRGCGRNTRVAGWPCYSLNR